MIANIIPYFPKSFKWQFSKKYVAGTTIDDAMSISSDLNKQGMMVTVDLLGEFIKNMEEAAENEAAYFDIINRLSAENINGGVSVKPTFFGLNINFEKCYQMIRRVVQHAVEKDIFVRIDMEDSECTSAEIELFRKLKAEFPNHVGLVLQAYLKRTTRDIDQLQDIHSAASPLNFRLCKGIYVEPEKIAYKAYQKVRDNFVALLEQMTQAGNYVGIATHDRYLVEEAYKLIKKYELKPDQYEFQMLYGVTPNLRDEIVANGHRMRIYIPFGKDWFGYCTRRLKENPKMANDIIKGIFVRG